MFQRIQTVYLLLAIVVMIGMALWFPEFVDADGTVVTMPESIYLFGALLIGILLAVFAVILFKNRPLQMKLIKVNLFIQFILLGGTAYRWLTLSGEISISKKGIEIVFPIISIVLLWMANKAVKRDDDLVKSADRLR